MEGAVSRVGEREALDNLEESIRQLNKKHIDETTVIINLHTTLRETGRIA